MRRQNTGNADRAKRPQAAYSGGRSVLTDEEKERLAFIAAYFIQMAESYLQSANAVIKAINSASDNDHSAVWPANN